LIFWSFISFETNIASHEKKSEQQLIF